MYVKEDLIMPHGVTFYELILTKARGKSGPLFHFDVHDDVRVGAVDHRVEKDESHAGKGAQCEIQMWHHAHTHTHTHTRAHTRTHKRMRAHGGVCSDGEARVRAQQGPVPILAL